MFGLPRHWGKTSYLRELPLVDCASFSATIDLAPANRNGDTPAFERQCLIIFLPRLMLAHTIASICVHAHTHIHIRTHTQRRTHKHTYTHAHTHDGTILMVSLRVMKQKLNTATNHIYRKHSIMKFGRLAGVQEIREVHRPGK